jgi:hypothetical protein
VSLRRRLHPFDFAQGRLPSAERKRFARRVYGLTEVRPFRVEVNMECEVGRASCEPTSLRDMGHPRLLVRLDVGHPPPADLLCL